MDKKEAISLYEKYLRGECTLKEEKLLEDFLSSCQEDGNSNEKLLFDNEEETGNRLYRNIQHKIQSRKIRKFDFLKLTKYAAAISICLLAVWAFYFNKETNSQKKVVNPVYITKSTLKGQKLDLVLSDGTSIKLNSESELIFPDKFSKNKRIVYLKGEAFFDVKRDKTRPFVIYTENVQTTVLGTSFNINAYPENNHIQVSVITGKVEVKSEEKDIPSTFLLNADEMVTYNKSSNELKKELFKNDLVEWRNGILLFNGESFGEIVEKLERWYGVEFQLKKQITLDKEFYGRYNNENLSNILETLSYASGFNYKINNKQIIIY